MGVLLPFDIQPQPDDTTCGPTCLHAVYRYYGRRVALKRLLAEVPTVEGGGTIAVHLANHALRSGFSAKIVTWNLQVFDPTWFHDDGPPLRDRLEVQARAKRSPRLRAATQAYLEFLDLGGELLFEDLNPALLRKHLNAGRPIITGLSVTYMHRTMRERPTDMEPDDVRGEPVGHFVVLTGYDRDDRSVWVSDPLWPNVLSSRHTYAVNIERVVGSIYLGVLTYDANLLVLEPRADA